ncbi:hypothetical protein N665_0134s0011 [Sinapis alba]|nr:hypothetical protein N665_0134s0011 [Sinapis alba]
MDDVGREDKDNRISVSTRGLVCMRYIFQVWTSDFLEQIDYYVVDCLFLQTAQLVLGMIPGSKVHLEIIRGRLQKPSLKSALWSLRWRMKSKKRNSLERETTGTPLGGRRRMVEDVFTSCI